ncbi:hypothetical protein M3Y95_01125600 [Aphelenchoides besseyi]|nr:hypothetical protein M3Y95_01125600 [Aphelenchoides besseyi]
MQSLFCILLFYICVLYVNCEENESDGLIAEVNKTDNLPQTVGIEVVNNSTDPGLVFGLNRKSKKQRAKGKKRASKGKKSRKSKDADSCKDKVQTCDRAKNYCKDAKLQETLKKNCAKTCGHCKGGDNQKESDGKKESGDKKKGGKENAKEQGDEDEGKQNDGECADESSTCPQWDKNGFCKSEYYTEEEKREKCAKTCNLCKNDGGKDDGDEEGTEDNQKEGKEGNEAEEKPKSGNKKTKKSGKSEAGKKKTRTQKSKKQNKKGSKSKKNSKRANGKKNKRG